MGKTTKYHPIPMSVIRGSAEYCGFKFGKIKQTHVDQEFGRSWYIVDVDVIPDKYKDLAINLMSQVLQDCFVQQIEVRWLRQSKSGQWRVDLLVDINRVVMPPVAPNGGGGGGGEYPENDDMSCYNENCHFCDEAINIDEQDFIMDDGYCYHSKCYLMLWDLDDL